MLRDTTRQRGFRPKYWEKLNRDTCVFFYINVNTGQQQSCKTVVGRTYHSQWGQGVGGLGGREAVKSGGCGEGDWCEDI